MATVLIKFTEKRAARFFLRCNALQHNKKSSLYKIKNDCHLEQKTEDRRQGTEKYYLLIGIVPGFTVENSSIDATDIKKTFMQTLAVEIVNEKTEAEELLFVWAQSEISNDIKFIEYETRSGAKTVTDSQFKPMNDIESSHETAAENYSGRVIIVSNIEVIRTFEPLFDVMAILNYTPNSFSDGGVYNSREKLKERIIEQLKYGATIIDIGVESTKPNTQLLSFEEEIAIWKEILPTIMQLKNGGKLNPSVMDSSLRWDDNSPYGGDSQKVANRILKTEDNIACHSGPGSIISKFILSIDTYHNETVLWLLKNGIDFDIINDVSGNIAADIVKRLIARNKKYIAMHNLGIPHNANNIIPLEQNPIDVINAFFMKKKREFIDAWIGAKEIINNVIFDPGIGFGNNAAQAWYIIKNLDKLDSLGSELLLGHSRKSFMNHITAKPYKDRDIETAIITLQVANSVDYVRVHDTNFSKMFLTLQV